MVIIKNNRDWILSFTTSFVCYIRFNFSWFKHRYWARRPTMTSWSSKVMFVSTKILLFHPELEVVESKLSWQCQSWTMAFAWSLRSDNPAFGWWFVGHWIIDWCLLMMMTRKESGKDDLRFASGQSTSGMLVAPLVINNSELDSVTGVQCIISLEFRHVEEQLLSIVLSFEIKESITTFDGVNRGLQQTFVIVFSPWTSREHDLPCVCF